MSFMHYDAVERDSIIPKCPNCSKRENVSLVDSKLEPTTTNGNNGLEVVPVWHCSKCSKLFGQREWGVTNILNSHGNNQFNVNPAFSPATANTDECNDLAEDVHRALLSNYNGGANLKESIKRIIRDLLMLEGESMLASPLLHLEQKIEKRVAAAMAIENDPLTAIRKSVAAFTLR